MLIKKSGLLLLIFLSIIISSCSDSPTSIGRDLLRDDSIDITYLDSYEDSLSQSSTFYKKVKSLGFSELLLVGVKNNIEASSLINYHVVVNDSIQADANEDSIVIVSAEAIFQNAYSFGDSIAPVDFSVHSVSSYWTTSFTSDSLPSLTYDAVDLSYDRIISDSAVYFKIDNATVLKWIKQNEDTSGDIDKGLYLKPAPSSQKVIGLQALSSIVESDLFPMLNVIIQKPGVYQDTLTFYPSADVSVVKGETPIITPGNIVVQSGVAFNSRLWFDLSSIPPNSIINTAELILTLDTTQTLVGSEYIDALSVSSLVDTVGKDTSDAYATLTRDNSQFKGYITGLITNLYNSNNHGLLVRAANEVDGVEIFTMLGSTASDPALRPRLKITYTNKK